MPLGHEPLDLKLVCELVELERIDVGTKSARGRTHTERFPRGRRFFTSGQASSQHFVDDGLEAGPALARQIFQCLRHIVVDGECRSHTLTS